jgi:hypothetical protein
MIIIGVDYTRASNKLHLWIPRRAVTESSDWDILKKRRRFTGAWRGKARRYVWGWKPVGRRNRD